MKNKIVSLILLFSMLIACLAGCSNPEDTDGSTDNGEPAVTYVEIAKNKKSDYQIVYSITLGETGKLLSEELANAINEVAGTKIGVYHDSEAPTGKKEIRIGRTNHVMDDLQIFNSFGHSGDNDFSICIKGDVIYIYSRGTVGIKNAIAYFVEHGMVTDEKQKSVSVASDFKQDYIEGKTPSAKFTGSDEHYLYFIANADTYSQSYVRVSFTGNKAWRIQTKLNEADDFEDIGASQRLSLSLGEEPVLNVEPITVKSNGDLVTATAPDGSYVALTQEIFGLKFYTESGNRSQHITDLITTKGGSVIVGDLLPNEGVFGTGERFDAVNQRTKKINMFTKDIWSRSNACYMVIPLLCLSRGSGVFLNIYEEMNLTLGTKAHAVSDVWKAEVIGANMDCYIYTSEKMSDAIYGYSVLSGFAEMPEEWTYGMIICRYSPDLSQKWSTDISKTNEGQDGRGLGVYDTIAKMEAYDLPWTTILAEGWGVDRSSKHEDLKELCDYVHSLGKKFMVYMRVGRIYEDQAGFEYDYRVTMTQPDGKIVDMLPANDTNNPDTGGKAGSFPYLDITNPAAVEWFFGEYWGYLSNEIGVDGCKIDFCETLPEYYELNYYDADQPTSGSHHWYPTAFCAMFWDMISAKPDSGMNYTRGGGIGSQRSPYMWAGDQKRIYESLKFQLVACLSSGMSGVPFMSYDMSGYQYGSPSTGNGTGPNDEPYQEGHVFVRGLQFTAFTVCMQQHGKVRQAFEFADGFIKKEYVKGVWVPKTRKDAEGNVLYATDENGQKIPLRDSFGNIQTDNEGNVLYQPEYDYLIRPGEMSYITDIYRGYVKLHEALFPYLNEYSEIACTTGMPLMRPLVLMWQDDTNVYRMDDEYMFGDAFLVAPVLNAQYKRDIYLPEGKWMDINTGEEYTVGKEGKVLKNYKAELQQLPVFYNMNTTSSTAAEILPAIQEIFDYINSIDCSAFYEHTGKQP